MENKAEVEFSRLEFFPLDQWDADLNVGLKVLSYAPRLLEVKWAVANRA